MVLVGLYAQSE